MGFLDDARDKAEELHRQAEDVADAHGDKIKEGLDQAEELIADKLPADRRDQAGAVIDKAKEMVERLGDGDDDPVGGAASREQR